MWSPLYNKSCTKSDLTTRILYLVESRRESLTFEILPFLLGYVTVTEESVHPFGHFTRLFYRFRVYRCLGTCTLNPPRTGNRLRRAIWDDPSVSLRPPYSDFVKQKLRTKGKYTLVDCLTLSREKLHVRWAFLVTVELYVKTDYK